MPSWTEVEAAGAGGWPASWPSEEAIRAMARAMATRSYSAEALLQDAVTRGLSVDQGSRAGLSAGWFRVTLRNLLIDHDRLRRTDRGRVSGEDAALAIENQTVRTHARARQMATTIERIMEEVAALPPDRRDLVRMKFYEGRSNAEIAAEASVSASTIDRRIRETLGTLSARLQGRDGKLPSGILALAALPDAPAPTAPPTTSAKVWQWSGLRGLLWAAVTVMVAVPAYFALVSTDPLSRPDGVRVAPGASGGSASGGGGADDLMALDRSLSPAGRAEALTGRAEPALPTTGLQRPVQEAAALVDSTGEEAGPEHESRLRLEINGVSATGWATFEPIHEPDGTRLASDPRPRSRLYGETDEKGVYSFTLPDAGGVWLLRLVDPESGTTVWVRDVARTGETRRIAFDTASVSFVAPTVPPGLGSAASQRILLANPEPGVWVAAPLTWSEERDGEAHARAALVGRNHLVPIAPIFDPDAWIKADAFPVDVRPATAPSEAR